jgi:hypothetical protein
MSVAYTLALTQDKASHLWMLRKFLPTKVNWASLALGEISSVREKDPGEISSVPEKDPKILRVIEHAHPSPRL